MHLCSNASELCEVQKLKGVTALSSKAVTAGLTEQHWCSWHEQNPKASVLCIFAEMQQRWVMQKLTGVTALSSKAVTAGLTEQHWCSWHEQVSQASVMCIFAQMQQRWVNCKNPKV